ncbi:MAG: hypothetical protein R3D66_05890 [Alphaproteobacteria bacterium]
MDKLYEAREHPYVKSIEQIWGVYAPYAAPSFQTNFLRACNTSSRKAFLWEMMLVKRFLEEGFEVLPNPDDDRPDISLLIGGRRVWVECTVPTRGHPFSHDYKEKFPSDGKVRKIDMEPSVLRCANSLDQKKKQYQKWLDKGVCKHGEPYIIAINGSNLDLRIYQSRLPEILSCVYSMGNLYSQIGIQNGSILDCQSVYEIRDEILKNNGSSVSMAFFINPENCGITGLIYSTDEIGLLSASPLYCYVQNVNAPVMEDWGPSDFMTYSYSEDGGGNRTNVSR